MRTQIFGSRINETRVVPQIGYTYFTTSASDLIPVEYTGS